MKTTIAFFSTQRIHRILLLIDAVILITPLMFPLVFGKTFFLSPTFVTANLFNIFVEISLLIYIILIIKDKSYAPYFTDIHILSILVLVSMLVSTLLGLDSILGFWGGGKRGDGVFFIIHTFLYMCVITWTLKKESEWFFLLRSAVFAGFITGSVALIGKALFQMNFLTSDPIVGQDLLFGNPSALAHFLVLLIPPVMYLLFAASVKKPISLGAFFYSIVLLFFLMSVYISNSLTGQIISAVLTGCFLVLLTFYNKKFFAPLFGYIVAGSALIFIKMDMFVFWEGFIRSLSYRLHMWKMIVTAFAQRPFLGYGWFNLRFVYDSFYDPWLNYNPFEHVDKAHNIFFEYLIATGAIGFILFLIFTAYLFYILVKHCAASFGNKENAAPLQDALHFTQAVRMRFVYLMFIAIFASHYLFLQFNVLFVPSYIYSAFLLALLILVLPSKRITMRFSSRIAIGCLFLAAPLIVFSIISLNAQPLLVNYRVNKLISQVSHRSLEPKKILDEAEAVRKIPIRHFEIADNLALVFIELANHPSASLNTQKKLYEAIKEMNVEILGKHPLLSVNYAKLALHEALFGKNVNPRYKEDAEAYFKKALSFNPEQGAYIFQLGKFYYADGLYETACPLFVKLSNGTFPKVADFYSGLCAARNKEVNKAYQYIVGSLTYGKKDVVYWQRTLFTPKATELKIFETAFAEAGLQKEIVPLYQDMIENQSENFNVHRGLLLYYKANNREAEKKREGDKMLELFPQRAAFINALLK